MARKNMAVQPRWLIVGYWIAAALTIAQAIRKVIVYGGRHGELSDLLVYYLPMSLILPVIAVIRTRQYILVARAQRPDQ